MYTRRIDVSFVLSLPKSLSPRIRHRNTLHAVKTPVLYVLVLHPGPSPCACILELRLLRLPLIVHSSHSCTLPGCIWRQSEPIWSSPLTLIQPLFRAHHCLQFSDLFVSEGFGAKEPLIELKGEVIQCSRVNGKRVCVNLPAPQKAN